MLLAALLALGVVSVRAELVAPVRVASGSMEPTLREGDVVLVDRREVRVDDLDHGDLVTFRAPDGAETLKRVVGLPGETVAVLDAVLHVDGLPVLEPYVVDPEWDGTWTAQVTVPDGTVYVLGDDRLRSVDSRDHGPVREADLDGVVLGRIWPPHR